MRDNEAGGIAIIAASFLMCILGVSCTNATVAMGGFIGWCIGVSRLTEGRR